MTKRTRAEHKFYNALRAVVGSRRFSIQPQPKARARAKRWMERLITKHGYPRGLISVFMGRVCS